MRKRIDNKELQGFPVVFICVIGLVVVLSTIATIYLLFKHNVEIPPKDAFLQCIDFLQNTPAKSISGKATIHGQSDIPVSDNIIDVSDTLIDYTATINSTYKENPVLLLSGKISNKDKSFDFDVKADKRGLYVNKDLMFENGSISDDDLNSIGVLNKKYIQISNSEDAVMTSANSYMTFLTTILSKNFKETDNWDSYISYINNGNTVSLSMSGDEFIRAFSKLMRDNMKPTTEDANVNLALITAKHYLLPLYEHFESDSFWDSEQMKPTLEKLKRISVNISFTPIVATEVECKINITMTDEENSNPFSIDLYADIKEYADDASKIDFQITPEEIISLKEIADNINSLD